MDFNKIGVSGCFIETCKNLNITNDGENIIIDAELKKYNNKYKKCTVNYKGEFLKNNNGKFEVKTQNIVKNTKIPKNIFRTFKIDYNENIKKSWTEKHPNYNYYFFNDNDCLKLIKENFNEEILNTYMKLNIGAPRADLWRCCILYLYGGIYIDIDCECINNIDELINNYDFVVPVDTDRARYALFNAFMASTPRNNILYHMINKIIYNVKNKIYIERHDNKGDAFSISGPGCLGDCLSELLNNPYKTLYNEGELLSKIPYYNRFIIGKKDNDYEFILDKNNIINKCLFYYSFSNNNDSNWEYNFILDKSNINENKIMIKRIDSENQGWNHDLDIAVNYKSSITKTNVFYFGDYNYYIGNSNNNNLIVKIYHDEYDKLLKNINYLKIDFLFKIDGNSLVPTYTDYFKYNIINFDKESIYVEIIRLDNDSGWGMQLNISIYYSSLLIDTEFSNDELNNSTITIYDSYGYIFSNTIKIEKIDSKLIYDYEIIDTQILISIKNYYFFIPYYTIINIIIQNPCYEENQNINLLWHNQFPENISKNNNKYIITQTDQPNKDNIITSYTRRCVYTDNFININHNKKIGIICSFPYHYEMFGFLIQYNKENDIYANLNEDKFEHIKYYENIFDIKIKSINNFNHNNYDIIINHTDDNCISCPSDKLILIEHEVYQRNNSSYYLTVCTLSKNRRFCILPTWFPITKEEKLQIILKENIEKPKNINIIYFNNGNLRNKKINNDLLIKILLNTLNYNSIIIYYKRNDNILNIINYINKQIKNNEINFIDITNINTLELVEFYKKCHYSIIGDEHFNYSGNIGFSISYGCKLLSSKLRKDNLKYDKIICYNDIEYLDLNLDYDLIFKNINDQINNNNYILNRIINNNNENLFIN